jgi:hypothetical protein
VVGLLSAVRCDIKQPKTSGVPIRNSTELGLAAAVFRRSCPIKLELKDSSPDFIRLQLKTYLPIACYAAKEIGNKLWFRTAGILIMTAQSASQYGPGYTTFLSETHNVDPCISKPLTNRHNILNNFDKVGLTSPKPQHSGPKPKF